MWNRLAVITVLLIAFMVCFSSNAVACWGFRPMGMGGIFSAVADDANLAYWNRAGSAQLDNWHDGESQIATSSLIINQNKIFDRDGRRGNTYYDSINFAQKINHDWGWSVASEWSGGGSFAISPSLGYRLPFGSFWDKMSLGVGYYLWNLETYDVVNNAVVRIDVLMHQIHLDYLWKVHPEFNFGIHIERFWQPSATITSPDVAGSLNTTGNMAEHMNFRPAVAWLPQGALKGLIVNGGFYDLFAQGGGPHFSLGFEYAPPAEREIVTYVGKSAGKGKKGKIKTQKVIKKIKDDSWLSHSAFRAGLYNLAGTAPYSLLTLGYGYKINEALEIGYWGGFGVSQAASGAHDQNLGVSWKF